MHILIITDYLPYPPVAGDLIRTYNLIRRIASRHQVSLAGFLQDNDENESLSHMQKFCYKVEAARLIHRSRIIRLPNMLGYLLAGIPPDLEFLYSEELANKIKHLISKENFDIVQIEQSRMALYLKTLPIRGRFKRILAFHNVASMQYDRIFRVARSPVKKMRTWLHSRMLRQWEPQIAEQFDGCITVSDIDRRLLIKANPGLRVDVVPNGVDTKLYQPLELDGLGPSLLLIGNMGYPPCADGALWFCNQILPLIRRKVDKIQVWIVGLSPPPEVRRLSGNNVHVTGRVEDLLPYYKQSAICIVPLRAGGGTRLKVLEAMALGRPVVSTSIGCEGLDVVNNRHLLVADNPRKFAEETIRLLTNKALYHRIIAEARDLAVTKYDWDIIAKKLLNIYSIMTQ